jgi:hypothetical protein
MSREADAASRAACSALPPRPSAPSTRSTLLPTALRLASLAHPAHLGWQRSLSDVAAACQLARDWRAEPKSARCGDAASSPGRWQRARPLARDRCRSERGKSPAGKAGRAPSKKTELPRSIPSTHGGRRPYYRPSREAPIKLRAKNPFSRMRPGGLQPKGVRKKQCPIPDLDEAARPSDTRRLIAAAPPRHLQPLSSTSQALWGGHS